MADLEGEDDLLSADVVEVDAADQTAEAAHDSGRGRRRNPAEICRAVGAELDVDR